MSHYPRITKGLMDEWRQAQGHRGAKGVIEVLRALEFIAIESIAARWGISTARADWESSTKSDVQEAA